MGTGLQSRPTLHQGGLQGSGLWAGAGEGTGSGLVVDGTRAGGGWDQGWWWMGPGLGMRSARTAPLGGARTELVDPG